MVFRFRLLYCQQLYKLSATYKNLICCTNNREIPGTETERESEEERIYGFNFPERYEGDGAASVHCCFMIMGLMCFTEFTPLLITETNR